MSENGLKIYFIKLPDKFVGYDCRDSMIIVAKNRTSARKIAAKNAGDKGGQIWFLKSDVQWIGYPLNRIKKGVICSSFNQDKSKQ